MLISDYCCKEGKWSDVYTQYVKQRGYHLLSPPQYGRVRYGYMNAHLCFAVVQYEHVCAFGRRHMIYSCHVLLQQCCVLS